MKKPKKWEELSPEAKYAAMQFYLRHKKDDKFELDYDIALQLIEEIGLQDEVADKIEEIVLRAMAPYELEMRVEQFKKFMTNLPFGYRPYFAFAYRKIVHLCFEGSKK